MSVYIARMHNHSSILFQSFKIKQDAWKWDQLKRQKFLKRSLLWEPIFHRQKPIYILANKFNGECLQLSRCLHKAALKFAVDMESKCKSKLSTQYETKMVVEQYDYYFQLKFDYYWLQQQQQRQQPIISRSIYLVPRFVFKIQLFTCIIIIDTILIAYWYLPSIQKLIFPTLEQYRGRNWKLTAQAEREKGLFRSLQIRGLKQEQQKVITLLLQLSLLLLLLKFLLLIQWPLLELKRKRARIVRTTGKVCHRFVGKTQILSQFEMK